MVNKLIQTCDRCGKEIDHYTATTVINVSDKKIVFMHFCGTCQHGIKKAIENFIQT